MLTIKQIKALETAIASQLRTMQDVENFIRYCLTLDILFHPDESFYSYVNLETGKYMFADGDEQAAYLNYALRDCFEVCSENNVDIYELTTKIKNNEDKNY